MILVYTTTAKTSIDGTQKDFKFPLTGFNEKYLEQFI